MSELKGIRTALISFFYKDGLDAIACNLQDLGLTIYSTSGNVSLIRAASKNFKDVFMISDRNQYPALHQILAENKGQSSLNELKSYADAGISAIVQSGESVRNKEYVYTANRLGMAMDFYRN